MKFICMVDRGIVVNGTKYRPGETFEASPDQVAGDFEKGFCIRAEESAGAGEVDKNADGVSAAKKTKKSPEVTNG